MSTFEKLQRQRPQLMAIAHRHGATNVRVFGSVVRGEDTETSDVDFLVDMQEGRSLLDLVGLQQDFEQFLGQRIDVLTERGLNRYLKERILTEARPL